MGNFGTNVSVDIDCKILPTFGKRSIIGDGNALYVNVIYRIVIKHNWSMKRQFEKR